MRGPREVTLLDLISGLGHYYDSQGRRLSDNVEDRRHWKPETGQLHRLPVAGEDLPQIEYEFIPKAEYPAGDPRWHEGGDPEQDMAAILAELSRNFQATLADPNYGKPSDMERLKDTGQRTLWHILEKLEEWGWGD